MFSMCYWWAFLFLNTQSSLILHDEYEYVSKIRTIFYYYFFFFRLLWNTQHLILFNGCYGGNGSESKLRCPEGQMPERREFQDVKQVISGVDGSRSKTHSDTLCLTSSNLAFWRTASCWFRLLICNSRLFPKKQSSFVP